MPAAVIGAVVAETIGGAVLGATIGEIVIGSIASKVIGGVAGFVASSLFTAAFSDGDGGQQAAATFEQELKDNLITVRQPITHWQYIYGRDRVGGAMTYFEVTSPPGAPANGMLHLVITLAGHECEAVEEVWFDDEVLVLDGAFPNGGGDVASGKYAGFAAVHVSLGNETGQPFPELVAYSASHWTDAHRQSGRTKIYVRLGFNRDVYPTGIPNITVVVKGKKVYDPRSGLTAWSDNADLCIADFLCDPVWLNADYDEEIDETQLIAAANIDDEDVTLAGGGTENRYTLNGSFPVNGDARSILERMLTANAGRVYYIGGVFRQQPAAYVTPTITFDEDSLRGVPQVDPRLPALELCNRVKGVYVSEENLWQPTDFPPVTNATYLAEDAGEPSWRELDLPFTKSAAMAQRIAKIELERARQQISVVWPGQFTCYRAQPGDVQLFTFAMLGWTAKAFEIVSGGLDIEEDGNGAVRLGSTLGLRETAAAVFDWNSGEETTVDLAPDSNLPSAFSIAAPGAPAVSEALYETAGARRVAARATVEWTVNDALADAYEVQYKLAADAAWTVMSRTADTTVELIDLAAGAYHFRVKAINALGVSSAWSPTTTREIIGLAARPAAPSGLAIQAIGGQALVTFTQHPELDVLRGGRILVRHCEDIVAPTWESAFSIGSESGWPGDAVYVLVPLKAGTYLLKAEDAGGRQSSAAATIDTRQASVLAFSSVGSVTEDPVFTGTHSSTVRDGSTLKLTGAGLFDDIADFDAVSSLDDYGGVAASGTYTFSAGIDLGSVGNVRLTGAIEGLTVNVNDLFDDRSGSIDDWLDFDGTAGGGSGDAYLEVRQTDDNPAGSPTWSGWVRLDAAEKRARAFQFRLQIVSHDVAYNEHITGLAVTAEQVV